MRTAKTPVPAKHPRARAHTHACRCEFHGCSRRPVFSHKGEKPRFCLAHKLDGMQDSRLNAEGRGRARGGAASRPSQVAAAQQRMYGGGQGGYGRAGGGRAGSSGGHIMGGDMDDMMFAGGGGGGDFKMPIRNVQARQAVAQATVSAAAAVIAAIEDETRLDYRGHSSTHGGHRSGGGFRESDADMYEALQHGSGFGGGGGGGGSGLSRPKTEIGAWASALFGADGRDGRDGNGAGSLDSSRPSSAGMAPPHGYGEVWQSAPPRATASPPVGSSSTLSDVSNGSATVGVVSSREMSEADMYHRMGNVSAPMGGGGGGAPGRGVLSSQHYAADERSNRGFLNGLGGSGGSGSGDFVSSFSSQQSNTWQGGNDDDGSGGGGGADLQWERAERSRPRPPPLPAPLSQSMSSSSAGWGRAMGVSASSDMHRHGGRGGVMHAPSQQQQQQRLPSILNRRGGGGGGGLLGGVSSGGMGGYAGGDVRDGGGYDMRSGREQV